MKAPAKLRVAALIVAAGRGSRVGGAVPKQYRLLGGQSVLARTLALFEQHPAIDSIVTVIGAGDEDLFAACSAGISKHAGSVPGGSTRQASCLAGLKALIGDRPDIVLLHDAARPFASPALIDRAIEAARAHGAAVPGLAVTDTIKQIDMDGRVKATPERSLLRAVQTPQAFGFDLILSSHLAAAEAGIETLTDDGAVAEWAGHPLHIFEGEATNMKLTTESDFQRAEQAANDLAALGDVRTGTGFDVHAFDEGDHVWLNGVKIPHERALKGHSDADVGLHALTDAILGAIGDGDIGSHFPPSDPQWKGASSDRFLAHAVGLVRARGGAIAHLDVTLLCEAPKVGPHRDAMRARIAEIAGIAVDRVGVKATTTEGLGFTGRREGIAAMASATVRLPWS
ncbi:bifunctional 2-C-methyl-D-erythritol 4-phosphate cytidylyltransferase/2-C-methyl-D-erythritol 2,4-cyclodiphosphate synthase [Labrys neptuniae]|uniref:bifunctional 2-C-methyl-D-erythritol 4-phosphate cytidylyltransferase/2-C-methyl-D-erythritol 2,4-cyclodiphosphate synthase n=1 Tax=Labrys neptuniae TaxID=376174 RepID=UPI00288FC833|nr:bifunctional 2-C-methyl-D-erythritol 4-phosphate cytidylyltransferase/2-C-methyl-D-erythritol 2,4-cyclodiphosphate synthase [Labrys neptuniae]MDT3378966.1 bifunctional 2-C-methyl-D-erythritol 4-phosphate cytidylyltransferase/2-C-methyl-D-erythritol 2,4-cyclodiphosphate synthase [Labrys neptuniae]